MMRCIFVCFTQYGERGKQGAKRKCIFLPPIGKKYEYFSLINFIKIAKKSVVEWVKKAKRLERGGGGAKPKYAFQMTWLGLNINYYAMYHQLPHRKLSTLLIHE